MARKGGTDGGNSKKAMGQARKANAAAKKVASAEADREAAETSKWERGAKTRAKREADEEKRAELAKKKAERQTLLAEEEKNTPGRSTPKNAKAAVKKTRGMDPSQLDDDLSGSGVLNASGIENALDALSLMCKPGSKVERHPERRYKAAYDAFEERRLQEMVLDGSAHGLRLNQKRLTLKKEFERSPENPFNQLTLRYDATKEEEEALLHPERGQINSCLVSES